MESIAQVIEKCPNCDGDGRIGGWVKKIPAGEAYYYERVKCSLCNGYALIPRDIAVTYALDRDTAFKIAIERWEEIERVKWEIEREKNGNLQSG